MDVAAPLEGATLDDAAADVDGATLEGDPLEDAGALGALACSDGLDVGRAIITVAGGAGVEGAAVEGAAVEGAGIGGGVGARARTRAMAALAALA